GSGSVTQRRTSALVSRPVFCLAVRMGVLSSRRVGRLPVYSPPDPLPSGKRGPAVEHLAEPAQAPRSSFCGSVLRPGHASNGQPPSGRKRLLRSALSFPRRDRPGTPRRMGLVAGQYPEPDLDQRGMRPLASVGGAGIQPVSLRVAVQFL